MLFLFVIYRYKILLRIYKLCLIIFFVTKNKYNSQGYLFYIIKAKSMKLFFNEKLNGKEMSLYVKKAEESIDECKLYNEKELAMIGISLGNSYFSETRLKLILSGFSKNFKKVAVLLVDDLSMHNYLAMGYSKEKAKKKIKKASKSISNKILKIIDNLKIENNNDNIKFYKWKDVQAYSGFENSLKYIYDIYEKNHEFSSEINKGTLNMIGNYITDDFDEKEVIEEAKWYLLKELAFAYCASDFFNSSLLTCYYNDFTIYRNMLKSKYNGLEKQTKHDILIYECVEDG